MSTQGIDAKRKWMKDYFELHPDSREITLIGTEISFPGFFDYAYSSNNRDGGNVEQQKRAPHITFFSEWAEHIDARTSRVSVGGKEFGVYSLKSDLTEETFQAEIWLV